MHDQYIKLRHPKTGLKIFVIVIPKQGLTGSSPAKLSLHSSLQPDSYKIFSYTTHLSTSGRKQDVYSILLEALPGNIMTLLTMVQES